MKSTQVSWTLLLVSLWGATAAGDDVCAGMKNLMIEDTTVTIAQWASSKEFAGTDSHANKLFCRVGASIRPTEASNIGIEVWLPVSSEWNGKFLGTGSGGVGGTIVHRALVGGLDKGFATANTDMGSARVGGTADFGFGIGQPEKQIDWAHRSTHLMTTVAKRITQSFYGRRPSHALFSGCSTGGLQAIAEATRYPEDYDGIVAAAPGNNRTGIHMAIIWDHQAVRRDPDSYFSPDAIPMIHEAVLGACDGLDGIVDGVIDDPRRCHFDPAVLQCRQGRNDNCLTPPQVDALRKIYAGPSNPRTGERLFPGMTPGAEAGPWGLHRILSEDHRLVENVKGLLAWAEGSSWDGNALSFDFDVHAAHVNEQLGHINALSTDYRAFNQAGGKILFWVGAADGFPHYQDLIDYYEAVMSSMGGEQAMREFSRLFLAPGVNHCGSGVGPNKFDMIDALDAWVSRDVAPERIIATKYYGDNPAYGVERTRPLCPYPQIARWNGLGSTSDARNFVCSKPAQ